MNIYSTSLIFLKRISFMTYNYLYMICLQHHFCIGSFTEPGEERVLTSEKLQKLGWSYRPLEETLIDSVESYKKAGILN